MDYRFSNQSTEIFNNNKKVYDIDEPIFQVIIPIRQPTEVFF